MESIGGLVSIGNNIYILYVVYSEMGKILTNDANIDQSRSLVPVACRRRLVNWGGPLNETAKTEVRCHKRCYTTDIPPPSAQTQYVLGIALNFTAICRQWRRLHRYERNILEWNVMQQTNKQKPLY